MKLLGGGELLKVAWLYITILPALTNAQLELEFYVFNQCECRDSAPFIGLESPFGFSAVPNGFVAQGDDIACPSGDTGITNNNLGSPGAVVIGEFDSNLFLTNDGADRATWGAVFDFQADPADGLSVLRFSVGSGSDLDLDVTDLGLETIELGGEVIDRDPDNKYRVVFGESFAGEDPFDQNAFAFCVVGASVDNPGVVAECGGEDSGVSPVNGEASDFGVDAPPSTLTLFPASNSENDNSGKSFSIIAAAFATNVPEFNDAVDLGSLQREIRGFMDIDIKQPPLPVLPDPFEPFTVAEDAFLQAPLGGALDDTNLNIDFFDLVGGERGEFTLLNDGAVPEFRYEPDDDQFGDDFFNISYTSQDVIYQCVLDLENVPVVITPENDVPVLIQDVFGQQTVGLVPTIGSIVVANDLDLGEDNPTLLQGFVLIESVPSKGELFEEDCETPLGIGGNVTLNPADGSFSFCYQGTEENFQGQEDSFTFTASDFQDVTQTSQVGTITLFGGNPVEIPNVARELPIEENDDQPPSTVVDDRFSVPAPGVDVNVPVSIKIVSLPPATDGELRFEDVPIVLNQVILLDPLSLIQFVPAPNRFNAINNVGVNADGQPFTVDCPVETVGQDVCPIQFNFVLAFGENGEFTIGDPTPFNIIVNAVDDVPPRIVDFPAEEQVADINEVVNDFIEVVINGITFARDDDANAFKTTITLRTTGGVTVGFDGDLEFIDFVGILENEEVAIQCNRATRCLEIAITGFIFRLNALFDEGQILAFVPDVLINEEPTLSIDVAGAEDGNDFAAIRFQVDEVNDGVFDDQNNIIYAAAAGGGLVLVGIIIAVIRITTVRADEGGVAALEEDKPVRFQARGNVKSSGDKRRSFQDDEGENADDKEDVENEQAAVPAKENGDPLLDWEKHIDPKTKEPFYHNPQTGETVWELPDI